MHDLHERKQAFFREELKRLKEHKYISPELYEHMKIKHAAYYESLGQAAPKEQKPSKQVEKPSPTKIVQRERVIKPVKSKPSTQQIRERNITWSLILGVILLLIGGLVLATSTWDTLNNLMKTSFITLVSIVFYGLAFVTHRLLKIDKTAFAFIILGSLFLPIIFISIGFFELFGSYFSLYGDGKFVLGLIGSIVILPIYILFSLKLTSRLFVWFSYIMLTLFVSFILAACKLPVDGFYLGMMLFNAAMIYMYTKGRAYRRLTLFTKEFIIYIQTNLIFTSILLLVFYDNPVFYGFNLLITGVIYFSMVFVTNHKGYHFVFTAMLVYGAYQVIEFSGLHHVGPIGYALLGVLFLSLPLLTKETGALKRIFHYTSAFISAAAFLFITLQALTFRADHASIVMLVAYLVISVNFIYLANMTKRGLFSYLAPIFILVAVREFVLVLDTFFSFDNEIFPVFIGSALLYVLLGCLVKSRFLLHIKVPTRDITSGTMLILLIAQIDSFQVESIGTIKLGFMFLILSLLALTMYKFENRKELIKLRLAEILHPIMFGLSIYFFYIKMMTYTSVRLANVGPFGFVIASIFVYLVSYFWKHKKMQGFHSIAFYTATTFYTIGFIGSFTPDFNPIARMLITAGALGLAWFIYNRTKVQSVSYVISTVSYLLCFTVLMYIHSIFEITNSFYLATEFMWIIVFLVGIGYLLEKYDQVIAKAFWWVAHIGQPFTLLSTFILFGYDGFWAFAMATIIYILSIMKSRNPEFSTISLYSAYTSTILMFVLFAGLVDGTRYMDYTFFFVSMIIFINWFMASSYWKKIISYYYLPYTIVILGFYTTIFQLDIWLHGIALLSTGLLLYVIHKQRLSFIKIIPLLFLLVSFKTAYIPYDLYTVLPALYALVLITLGQIIYPKIYDTDENKRLIVDAYTLVAFMALLSMYTMFLSSLVLQLLPGVLITLALILQRNRLKNVPAKWILFIACMFALEPYYTFLNYSNIPSLIERELYVLPWVGLAIVLRSVDQNRKALVSYIQWAVLVVVALLLIEDALASNTVYDALIVGSLSLLSIIGGFVFRTKSFFFVGAGVLLLNLLLQTRPYWGNLQWWAYLLFSGTILITVASLNEWNKQKATENKVTFMQKAKTYFVNKMREWQ